MGRCVFDGVEYKGLYLETYDSDMIVFLDTFDIRAKIDVNKFSKNSVKIICVDVNSNIRDLNFIKSSSNNTVTSMVDARFNIEYKYYNKENTQLYKGEEVVETFLSTKAIREIDILQINTLKRRGQLEGEICIKDLFLERIDKNRFELNILGDILIRERES